MEQRLAEITLPIQGHAYMKNVKRIQELALQAHRDILDIKTNYSKRHPLSTLTSALHLGELKNFKTTVNNIWRETSAIYRDPSNDNPIRLRTRVHNTRYLVLKI